MNVLVDAFWQWLYNRGIKASAGKLARLLQEYQDLSDDFNSRF